MKMASFKPVIFFSTWCVLVMGVFAEVNFEDCGSLHGEFSSLKLTGCDPSSMDVCPLKRGKNVTIEVNFLTKEEVTKVDVQVHGHIVVSVPFILPNPNGCVDSGLTCPLANNTQNTYVLTLPIKMVYPKLKVDIKLELEDQNGEDIICVMIPAKIV
uniref:Niemann-Pick type C2 protein c n=1 Tax=Adelphocoris lineolatus TaxID=236346 RepID=A0A346RVH6_ADELI|nr:Niemann-Pick type C2 protein c [Adelphocoris lineolatus]